MLRKRSRLIAAPLAAVALSLTIAGYQATAAEPAGPAQKAAAPCLADATTLVGDLDGDGNPDKISDVGLSGTRGTIQWGNEDGSFGEKQYVSKLVGAKAGEGTTAQFADFDKDGTLDMVVNVVKRSEGDDPNTARIAEYRPGPVSRDDLSSPDARHTDIGDMGEAKELRIANYGDDEYPDVAVLNNSGDGNLDRSVRVTEPGKGIGDWNREHDEKYGETGTTPEPPKMPTDGWSHFYERCS
ncbi:FG-GAP repeat domain-containing protein [Streptomyces sp. NPDC048172]|uniref:FG-GAP repeat domain-containing protein n=1 Tax=Streptomyces sp. NPDC048172 TaxID=3365505 RepID=UPI0037232CD4